MKIEKEKIIEWLDLFFAKCYFKIRRFFEHGIIRFIIKLINKFYNLILFVLLLSFIISFLFFYIRHYLDISIGNIFINFQKFLENNLSIYVYLIITIFFIGFKYILEIFKFIFKYLINWNIFWIIFLLSLIIAFSNEKNFFEDLNYIMYSGKIMAIIWFGIGIKYLFLLDKENSRKGYYFNFYKKSYDKILNNSNYYSKIINLKNKFLKDFKNIKYIYIVLNYINSILQLFFFNKEKLKGIDINLNNIDNNFKKLFKEKKDIEEAIEEAKDPKNKIQGWQFIVSFGPLIKIGIILKILKNKNKLDNIYYNIYLKEIKSFNIKQNFIEPISDEPIGIGNDIFKNENFAKNIYDLMNGINFKKFKKSYSIGIVGEWGGGKSSIINLLDEQFLDGNPNFKVLRFNPWDYKKDKLINNFFGELSKILGIKEISSLFKNYLNLLGKIDSSVKIGLDFLSGFVGEKSLEEVRNEINFRLKEFDRKIVVVIDDLDRCEPDEVLMMLNLVKNLGDFNNIIYLVSYDKEHIIKVLDEKGFDKDYIEKIINIERFIPVPGKKELKEYFKKQFDEILKNLKKDDKELFKEEIRQKIIESLVSEFDELFEKENLRFIKKLLNQLNVILQLNLEKEDFEIKNLVKEDFINIFLINYIKLKDYSFYSFVLSKYKNIERKQTWYQPNRPPLLLNISEKSMYKKFLLNILDVSISSSSERGILSFYKRNIIELNKNKYFNYL